MSHFGCDNDHNFYQSQHNNSEYFLPSNKRDYIMNCQCREIRLQRNALVSNLVQVAFVPEDSVHRTPGMQFPTHRKSDIKQIPSFLKEIKKMKKEAGPDKFSMSTVTEI